MRTDEEEEERRRVLRDGEVLTVEPLTMMDGRSRVDFTDGLGRPAGHAPGYCIPVIDGGERAAAREEYVARLADAWRGERVQTTPGPDTRQAAYDARSEYLENAWRGR